MYTNPNCTTPCDGSTNFLYDVISRTSKGVVHFILPGNMTKTPISILMVEAANSKEIQVNWTRFLNRTTSLFHESIILDSKINSYGIILNEICTFSDINDDAEITELQVQKECLHFLGKNLLWSHTVTRSARAITFLYMANHSLESKDNFGKYGKIILNITIPKNVDGLQGKEDFSLVPGRGISLELTANNLLLEERTRIAPILLAFAEQPLDYDENFESSLEIDHTGQETLMNLFLAKRRKVQSYGYGGMSDLLRVWQSEDRTPAFIQWRTTCQVENSSSSSASRQVHMGPQLRVMKSYAKKYSHSLPYALYGDRFNQQQQQQNPIGLRLQAIVFGTPKDGFYMRTGYVSWRVFPQRNFLLFFFSDVVRKGKDNWTGMIRHNEKVIDLPKPTTVISWNLSQHSVDFAPLGDTIAGI
uniref:Lysosomal transcription factor, NCU-G1 n=1 Tax=Schistocephalus solidus TaxID=70667 RepID=A0A0X3PLV3_SCHSO